MPSRIATGLLLAAGLSLGGCYSDGYGYGGYGGISVGYSSAGYYPGYGVPGYYDPWYGGGWGHFGSYPYWGWYDDFYYPGSGVYVYDRWRRPHHWNDNHRRYWSERRNYWRGRGDRTDDRRELRENWADFRREGRAANRGFNEDRNLERRAYRQNDMRAERRAFRQSEAGRAASRATRSSDRQAPRRDFRQDRRAMSGENRREDY
jgi:hypothetical protein